MIDEDQNQKIQDQNKSQDQISKFKVSCFDLCYLLFELVYNL